MALYELIMPKTGMYDEDILLARWLKDEGAEIRPGELVFTLETDKITIDVEAEVAGWLHRTVEAGSTVSIGAVVGAIASTNEEYEALAASSEPAPADETRRPKAAEIPARDANAGAEASQVVTAGARKVSPRARALIATEGLGDDEVGAIPATGPEGRLTDRDVLAYLTARAGVEADAEVTPAEPRVERRLPLSGTRGVIARRMLESLHESAQLTSVLEIDASPIVDWRARRSPRPGFTTIFLALVARALRSHPMLNARIADGAIEILADVDLAFAVHTEAGVVAPVIRQLDRLGLAEIEDRVRDLSERARLGSLAPHELTGGSFTVSNSGTATVDMTTAILNPPQVAILWLGQIRERPIVVDGTVVARPTVHACLTYDHRAVDGVPAAEFLGELAAQVAAVADTFLADG